MNLTPPHEYHDQTVNYLVRQGCSNEAAEALFSSGYIFSDSSDQLLDTYYEMPIDIQQLLGHKTSQASVSTITVSSLEEASEAVTNCERSNPTGWLAFRGVNKEYFLDETSGREYRNPLIRLTDGKEISCIPSAYRRSIPNGNDWQQEDFFRSLYSSEIEYDGIDLKEQVKKNPERGLYSISDLEDDEDPINREIWKLWNNRVIYGSESTLLSQHYGLPTSALDLTTDIAVALFFASYKFYGKENDCATYIKNPNSEAAVYFFRFIGTDLPERVKVEKVNLYDHLRAERPLRQKCLLVNHHPLAVNDSAQFIIYRLKLSDRFNFEGIPTPEELFPDRASDPLYNKLLTLKEEGKKFYKDIVKYDFS